MNDNNMVEPNLETPVVQPTPVVEEPKVEEPKKKNNSLTVILVIILLAVVGVGCYFLGGYLKVCTNTCITQNENNSAVAKLDETKEYVYTAETKEYELDDITKKYYDLEKATYNLPYVNLNSDYAKEINESLKNVYDSLISENDEQTKVLGDQYLATNYFDYKFYVNGDILSLVVEELIEDPGNTYYIYNINLKTGEKATYEEILKAANLTKDTFSSTSVINTAYTSQDLTYCSEEYKTGYNSDPATELVSLQTPEYYVNDKGTLVLHIWLPVCAGQGLHSYLFDANATEVTLFQIIK